MLQMSDKSDSEMLNMPGMLCVFNKGRHMKGTVESTDGYTAL
jgi:hypothetical protein